MVRKILPALWRLPRNGLIACITLYQQTLSPDHGHLRELHPYGFCRHEPTCSEYAKVVLSERGVVLGMPMMLLRLLSCHPWRRIDEAKIRKILREI
ncbi:membrane protein insertion efficiency factor YidD [Candidatus Peregrinibacteria bacterium]|nr:membrane protein insertion efficiency factor YidD [Candidatus Peregrinibacteria bacterium]